MATLNAGTGLMSFPCGGQILIGSDTVVHIVEGSVRFTPTFHSRIPLSDQGVSTTPGKGILQPGSLAFNVKIGDLKDSSVFATLIADNSPATAYVKTFSIVIKRFAAPGLTTGESITCSDAYLSAAPEFSGGDGTGSWDTMSFTLGFSTAAVVADIT